MVYVMLGLQNATEEHQADPEVLDCLNLKVKKKHRRLWTLTIR